MNRVGLGLAVGAGYVLGRTKKAKLAFAVGTMVAGKRMQLSPRALANVVAGQLRDNPQFKEIGDQLREDLRGVGSAASGAMVERQLDALADRLHDRTSKVRGQLSGAIPGAGRDDDSSDDEAYEDDEAEAYEEPEPDEEPEAEAAPPPAKKAAAKKTAARKTAEGAAKKAPAKKTAAAKKAPAKKTAAKKAARKTAARKATAIGGAARGTRSRLPKGGGER
ncbi:DNA primase [Streptomyces flavalbus]|uniref:DNA primase n=1 Tax=Streptomyces flavalbus TaxID=2665155 RepID=A0ABW2WJG0_9ACTN